MLFEELITMLAQLGRFCLADILLITSTCKSIREQLVYSGWLAKHYNLGHLLSKDCCDSSHSYDIYTTLVKRLLGMPTPDCEKSIEYLRYKMSSCPWSRIPLRLKVLFTTITINSSWQVTPDGIFRKAVLNNKLGSQCVPRSVTDIVVNCEFHPPLLERIHSVRDKYIPYHLDSPMRVTRLELTGELTVNSLSSMPYLVYLKITGKIQKYCTLGDLPNLKTLKLLPNRHGQGTITVSELPSLVKMVLGLHSISVGDFGAFPKLAHLRAVHYRGRMNLQSLSCLKYLVLGKQLHSGTVIPTHLQDSAVHGVTISRWQC